jgi:hypothetical protein
MKTLRALMIVNTVFLFAVGGVAIGIQYFAPENSPAMEQIIQAVTRIVGAQYVTLGLVSLTAAILHRLEAYRVVTYALAVGHPFILANQAVNYSTGHTGAVSLVPHAVMGVLFIAAGGFLATKHPPQP